ncbi:MAG: circularly permuted type 2 ATP-grasp protein [Hyphomicrobiaceae bacterium]|nr:circularly permuted type 2 ATP-grasp protein [Hyphomicrobiaceae bacterium]
MTASRASAAAPRELPADGVAMQSPAPDYPALAGVYDEMVGLDGKSRDVWATFNRWLAETPAADQALHAQRIERLVYENFSDPQRGRQMWRLDLVPIFIDGSTWALIEAASVQRAQLYNALLADLYGDRNVLEQGLLPPPLVMSDPNYLRPLLGVHPQEGHLTFLALDFARDPSGNWRVIDAHTETPAGHGFALANRMVLGEVMAGLFRQSNALRIGQFYQSLSDDLLRRAKSDDPTIAVLSPGPETASFIGHSYMARYLGHLRVGGSDLRVVGNRVYLKTINGLRKIDLLVRSVEGRRADPLELSPNGFDGPVGLVGACRQNPGLVVNALGTAIVENRGLSGYLAALAGHFLGQDLIVPDSPRLWLGEALARDHVLGSLDRYVIHAAQEGTGNPGAASRGRYAPRLSPEDRSRLETDIRFLGANLVAEEPQGFATAPSWTADGLKPEPYALRVFVAAIDGVYTVMPGGLAITVDASETVALSSEESRSRDVWIVSEGTHSPSVSLRRIAAQSVQRQATALQSRVADNLFWLGRYCERADGTLRVLRQTLQRSAADLALPASYRPFTALRALIEDDPAAVIAAPVAPEESARWMHEICCSETLPQGLPVTFANIREIAVQCRDRLSEDNWRLLTALSAAPMVSRMAASHGDAPAVLPAASLPDNALDLIEAADELLQLLAAFNGMSHENMTRNTGWQFLDLGRRIERAYWLAKLLLELFQSAEADELEGDDMLFALQTADSYITFRSRYRFAPQLHLVLDLLMIDETNPRSLAYQLASVSAHIGNLPKSSGDAVRAPDQKLALDLLTRVRLADARELAATRQEGGTRALLAKLLGDLIVELPHLSQLVSRQYFSLADEQPQRLHPQAVP